MWVEIHDGSLVNIENGGRISLGIRQDESGRNTRAVIGHFTPSQQYPIVMRIGEDSAQFFEWLKKELCVRRFEEKQGDEK